MLLFRDSKCMNNNNNDIKNILLFFQPYLAAQWGATTRAIPPLMGFYPPPPAFPPHFPVPPFPANTQADLTLLAAGHGVPPMLPQHQRIHPIGTQCSRIRKKVQFQKSKKHYLYFQKWQKINFCIRKKFKTSKNAILNFFLVQKLILCHF